MKSEIYEQIKKYPGTSFAELETIKGFEGDYQWVIDNPKWKKKKILLWSGISKKGLKCLGELFQEGKIILKETNFLTYMADGKWLNPSFKEYKWVPSVFYDKKYGIKKNMKDYFPDETNFKKIQGNKNFIKNIDEGNGQ